MINAIDINSITDTNYLDEQGNKNGILYNIKKINIFVGENNSGKSRMLRALFNNENITIYSNKFINKEKERSINSLFDNLNSHIDSFNRYTVKAKIIIPSEFNDLNVIDKYIRVSQFINNLKIDTVGDDYNAMGQYRNINNTLNNIRDYLKKPQENTTQQSIKLHELDLIYIPILRGIECFDTYYQIEESKILNEVLMNENQRNELKKYKSSVKQIYKNKIVKAYKITNPKIVFTAESLYDEITSKLLGKEKDRSFIHNFEKFISNYFYDGADFSIIPQQNEGYLNVRIDETERALHDLGDGIKQLITIFYKIYEKKDQEAIFFIEEPELNLHPGYQRKFIEILQSDLFSKHQFFITTHSNHFIDSCFNYNNISVYKFINEENNNDTFRIINTSSNDIELLDLLGVNNSSVFLSNCTIWVEGISDKILISKYLSVYLKSKDINDYFEDIHYSFVEYGGNNVTHWAFISNDDISTINASGITNRSFIVCDNDNNSSKKAKRKENLKKVFKDNYYELSVREIENTISRNVLERTLFGNNEVKYKNKQNIDNYEQNYMGKFIDSHYNLKKVYGNNSTGTITNKLDFSKKIAENINSIEDLSKSALELCERVYTFISESNKGIK